MCKTIEVIIGKGNEKKYTKKMKREFIFTLLRRRSLRNYQFKVNNDYSIETRKNFIINGRIENTRLSICNRMSAMIEIAKILFLCKCEIYGGFIRDWLIDNKEANDIDLLANNIIHVSYFLSILRWFSSKNHISMTVCPIEDVICGKRVQIKFESCNFTSMIKCDAIILDNNKKPKVSDADVNNLLLNINGKLVQKIEHPSYTVEESIYNIQNKKFNFFQDWEEDENYSRDRVVKLLKKNYNCLYGVPKDKFYLFPQNLLKQIL